MIPVAIHHWKSSVYRIGLYLFFPLVFTLSLSCGPGKIVSDSPPTVKEVSSPVPYIPDDIPTPVPRTEPNLLDLVPAQPISVYAGTGKPGFSGDGGFATEAFIHAPIGLALDQNGNLYVAGDHRVRKIDAVTNRIETVAGTGIPGYNGDGIDAGKAKLKFPQGIAVDMEGNLYIADYDNGRVRMVDKNGLIKTVAGGGVPSRSGGAILDIGDGGLATDAWFRRVSDVAVDGQGNIFIIADNRLRKINSAGVISTILGTGLRGYKGDNGPGVDAEIASPFGIVVDSEGRYIYISDTDSHRIRRLDTNTNVVTTIAGIGKPAMGRRLCPIYNDPRMRSGGEGAGFEGDGGPAIEAKLDKPTGIDLGPDGNVYFSDSSNDRVRMIDLKTGIITTVADGGLVEGRVPENDVPGWGGNRTFAYAYFAPPRGLVIDREGFIFIADTNLNKVMVVSR